MRILIAALGLALLAGCVSPADLEGKGPTLEALTSKSPRDFSRCLTPKWQDLNSRVASTETEIGYRIRLDIDMVGTPVMAIVESRTGGAKVRVYTRNSTWSEWVQVARSCI
ncbi:MULTISPECIES: hypothetical protein [unclassified Pseudomonas]|uniref:hypothetical protein n=1 Tax=unclassified Pseudomonas TaxID=196821 RepID=UPI00244B79EF|nr:MULTISPECIES: hypothetical protein [unclassified Pseudomonas]MDH0300620.1 hypothetical protein [Pseudomonas sp. GD04091]MDH1984229.1 hypothetical protein [Pseudomonas sp. GD03689]